MSLRGHVPTAPEKMRSESVPESLSESITVLLPDMICLVDPEGRVTVCPASPPETTSTSL
jgi:hypothetical protein